MIYLAIGAAVIVLLAAWLKLMSLADDRGWDGTDE